MPRCLNIAVASEAATVELFRLFEGVPLLYIKMKICKSSDSELQSDLETLGCPTKPRRAKRKLKPTIFQDNSELDAFLGWASFLREAQALRSKAA